MIPIKKIVSKYGNGAHVCLPKELVGQEVIVIQPNATDRLLLKSEIIELIKEHIESARRY